MDPRFDSIPFVDFSKALPSREDHVFEVFEGGGLKYTNGGFEIEVLGKPQGLPTSLSVGLRLYRSGLRSSASMYRIPCIDLFEREAVLHVISEAPRVLECAPDTFASIFHNFIDLLEAKFQLQRTTNDTVPLESTLRKEAMAVLRNGNTISNLRELLEQSGIADPTLGLQLYLLSISRILDEPLHGILHGDEDITNRILSDISACLPKKYSSSYTALSPHALSYPPTVGYWKHRTLVLYGLEGGKGSTLVEYLLKGRSRRLVAHRSEEVGYRSREQSLDGPVQLLATVNKDLHPAFYGAKTVVLPVDATTLAETIYEDDIRKLAGLDNGHQREHAQKILQSIPLLLSPMLAVNPLVEQVSFTGLFGNDFGKTGLFLRLSHLVAVVDQYHCGMERTPSGEAVIIESRHMAMALKLFKPLWIRTTDELHFKLRSTHKRLVAYLTQRDGDPISTKPFTAREIRKPLELPPSTLKRHLISLLDYGVITIRGGNKAKGYRYQLLECEGPTERKQAYDTLLTELTEHGKQQRVS